MINITVNAHDLELVLLQTKETIEENKRLKECVREAGALLDDMKSRFHKSACSPSAEECFCSAIKVSPWLKKYSDLMERK